MYKKLGGLLFLIIFSLNSVVSLAQDKEPWQVEDTFKTKGIHDLQISADGEQLIFVVSETNLEDNKRYSSIWIWKKDEAKPSRLTNKVGSASDPRWSPNGNKIAFFKNDKSGLGLWTMNSDGSEQRKLANLERSNAALYNTRANNKLSWSPNGKELAYSAAGSKFYENDINPPNLPTGNDVMIINRMLYKTFYFYSDQRRTHIWTISAEGGEPKKISSGDFDYQSVSWSPNGKYIACISNQTGRSDLTANNDIVLLPSEGGKTIMMTHTVGPESNVRWSPDGSKLAYYGRERSGRSRETDAELQKIYTISLNNETSVDSGTQVNLTKPLDRWGGHFQWGHEGNKVYFTVQNEGREELYSASSEGGSVTSIIDGKGQVGDFSVAEDGTVYYVYGDFTHPSEIYRINSDGGESERLTSFNQDFVDQVAINGAEHFTYHSFDGLKIDGWIMKPSNYQKGKKYPMLLNIHGGPHGQYGYRMSGRFQEQTANGYAVLFLNPRGSSGKGQTFSDKVVGDIGGGDYKDIMTGLNYAIERYKFIDADRMGIGGGSYGGYMTNWIITHTNRFKAAVSVSSISNLVTQWSGGNLFLWYESDMGIIPYENYQLTWDRSPLKYVVGATTPTLFVHGRWDNDVPLSQATSMYMAMKRLGVDAEIALYPHEGHGVRNQPKHTADYHRRAINWFDKYLK